MKVIFLKVLCFVSLVSCGGVVKNGEVGEIKSSIFGDQIKEMRYFPPVYSNEKAEFTRSKMYFHFVKATTLRLDAIFKASAEKYRISGKINTRNARESQRIYGNIVLVFREIDSNKNLRDIKIPVAIRSVLEKQHSRFAFAMLISPGFSTFQKSPPNATALKRSRELLHPHIINAATIHVLIFDLEKNNIAFYRKRSGVRYLGNKNKFLEESLQQMFTFYFF